MFLEAPPGEVDQVEQRVQCRSVVEIETVDRRHRLPGELVDDSVEQYVAGREVGVDGLPGDAGGRCDGFHARVGPLVQQRDGGRQDRGPAPVRIRTPPASYRLFV